MSASLRLLFLAIGIASAKLECSVDLLSDVHLEGLGFHILTAEIRLVSTASADVHYKRADIHHKCAIRLFNEPLTVLIHHPAWAILVGASRPLALPLHPRFAFENEAGEQLH